MATENAKVNTRIQLKHDTKGNWEKATNFIPKPGEVIIYDIDENNTNVRFKVGDGSTTVNNLPFTDLNTATKTELEGLASAVAYISMEDNETVVDPDVSVPVSITVDFELSETSANPVQNKVITQEINQLSDKVNILPDVTTADAGKFLRVSSDGKIEAIRIMNAEEVSF